MARRVLHIEKSDIVQDIITKTLQAVGSKFKVSVAHVNDDGSADVVIYD